jgi:hypothetical protein
VQGQATEDGMLSELAVQSLGGLVGCCVGGVGELWEDGEQRRRDQIDEHV